MTESVPQNSQTELAKERNRIAADRTLLTWVRSSVSFIGSGFGINQIFGVLEVGLQGRQIAKTAIQLLSLLFIGLGVWAAIAAALDYQKELSQLRGNDYSYRSRPSLGLILGGSVAIASIVTFVVMWQEPIFP